VSTPRPVWPRVLALALLGLAWRFAVFLLSGRDGGLTGFIDAHCVWDCDWYSSIIRGGYQLEIGTPGQPERANWAFFPLYPLLAGTLVYGLGLTPPLAGFTLSNLLTVVTAVLAKPLLGSERAYWFFVATLMIGPFSVLFSSLYTESLFILLTLLALLALRRGKYLAAGGWMALLSATRVTGVLMVFGLAAQVVVDHRKAGGRWRDLLTRLRDTDLLLAIFLAPLGLFAYMAFLRLHLGDALAFSHIQRGWGREMEGPLSAIADVFAGGWTMDYYALLQWSWVLVALAGLTLCVVLALRGRFPEAIFCTLCIVASLSSGVGSMVRFVAGLLPLGMMASELLVRWRWLAWLALAVAIGLDAVVTLGWFNHSMFVM
jgi:hypothetical protein